MHAGRIVAAQAEKPEEEQLQAFVQRFGRVRPKAEPREIPATRPKAKPYEPEDWEHVRTPYGDND